jgi:hypothetical protein
MTAADLLVRDERLRVLEHFRRLAASLLLECDTCSNPKAAGAISVAADRINALCDELEPQ